MSKDFDIYFDPVDEEVVRVLNALPPVVARQFMWHNTEEEGMGSCPPGATPPAILDHANKRCIIGATALEFLHDMSSSVRREAPRVRQVDASRAPHGQEPVFPRGEEPYVDSRTIGPAARDDEDYEELVSSKGRPIISAFADEPVESVGNLAIGVIPRSGVDLIVYDDDAPKPTEADINAYIQHRIATNATDRALQAEGAIKETEPIADTDDLVAALKETRRMPLFTTREMTPAAEAALRRIQAPDEEPPQLDPRSEAYRQSLDRHLMGLRLGV